jgi:hypothetical protein
MQELIVDFNMVDEDGRIPAMIQRGPEGPAGVFALLHGPLHVGETVEAFDGEGMACKAEIEDIDWASGYVLIRPLGDTFHEDPAARRSLAV